MLYFHLFGAHSRSWFQKSTHPTVQHRNNKLKSYYRIKAWYNVSDNTVLDDLSLRICDINKQLR